MPLAIANAGYGDAAAFRHGLQDRGLKYVVGISTTMSAQPVDAVPVCKPYSGNGRPPVPKYPDPARSVKELVTEAGRKAARPVQWREGTRPGTGRSGLKRMYSRFVALRIRPAGREIRQAADGPELAVCWLLAEWPASESEPLQFWLSDLPEDTPLTTLVRLAKLRWRLDAPLLAILDEAANVCKIADLPDLYSHLGSRGVIPITILQSYRQGVRVWGEAGMDALWSAATIKLVGSGIDDADFADKLSRLVSDHDIRTVSVSTSESGRSRLVSMRQERVLPADAIRALPKGSALLLATGIRPALLRLKPWYREPDADRLGAASAKETAAITERALAKSLRRGDSGPAA